ncbi:MAG: hydrogenase maturation protease [Desulfobacula sp.]|jgi:coenzyme F420 hydrogenase subunit delta
MYLDLLNKDILVIGCGNPLLGDDGFGPAVIQSLESQDVLPDRIGLLDAGTSIRELLFDMLLSGRVPELMVIIDAVQVSHALPGEIIRIEVDGIPDNKIADYSLHQFPTTNMLQELKASCRMEIIIYAVQVADIPEMVRPGLSLPVKAAVPGMCDLIRRRVYGKNNLSFGRELPSC